MAGYKERDEATLMWNKIRRQITRDLDTEIANKREYVINKILGKAWSEYSHALENQELKELEGKHTKLVIDIISDIVPTRYGMALENPPQA